MCRVGSINCIRGGSPAVAMQGRLDGGQPCISVSVTDVVQQLLGLMFSITTVRSVLCTHAIFHGLPFYVLLT